MWFSRFKVAVQAALLTWGGIAAVLCLARGREEGTALILIIVVLGEIALIFALRTAEGDRSRPAFRRPGRLASARAADHLPVTPPPVQDDHQLVPVRAG